MPVSDPFAARDSLQTAGGPVSFYRLDALEKKGLCTLGRMPYSIRILLESLLRNAGGGLVDEQAVASLAGWSPTALPTREVPFMVGRVLMQDFTGVPAVVDLAAMREAMKKLGGDPERINPLIPTDLVIDHSVQVDFHAEPDALEKNEAREFERNRERYEFLRWGQGAFDDFLVIPPSTGIVHQVNVEYLARVVQRRPDGNGGQVAFPDTVVGTDSHTTMVNGLGVLGWGVGGIEAEAAMLGQPYYMLAPEVIGVRLEGRLKSGVLATDLVLHITQMLREHGVVAKFVEFVGPGLENLTVPDRTTLANMAPEYGATMGYFPVDEKTLEFLRLTGREPEQVDLVERYLKEQGLFAGPDAPQPEYSALLTLDMGVVETNLAGPKRPNDRVPLTEMKEQFAAGLTAPVGQRGFALPQAETGRTVPVSGMADGEGGDLRIGHGVVVLAAITSCTNTSNPAVLIGAGLVARNAVAKGLTVRPHVKTSLAPGSRVVTDYLSKSGLLPSLEALGFGVVGYGCTTCIGNSGPIPEAVTNAVQEGDLVAAAVLSGNRNFEGRIHPLIKANYLASPPLVVVYALAGRVDIDLAVEPVGMGGDGNPVFLKDIWPTSEEIAEEVGKSLTPEMYRKAYRNVREANPRWNEISVEASVLYPWDEKSTYIHEPPYFDDLAAEPGPIAPIKGMRTLLLLGDSVTTDHISPAGAILPGSEGAEFLLGKDVSQAQFNTFGARRGNDQVMVRGTFGNNRIKNQLAGDTEGAWTRHQPSGETMSIFAASRRYADEGVPLLVIGGKEYGTGSSRDWAAKGPMLLGVRAVIAESFERIHRSNLVGMGVLPLQFKQGDNAQSLKLTGEETFDLEGVDDAMQAGGEITVVAGKADGSKTTFAVLSRIDTSVELGYYRNGGILQTVLRQLLSA